MTADFREKRASRHLIRRLQISDGGTGAVVTAAGAVTR